MIYRFLHWLADFTGDTAVAAVLSVTLLACIVLSLERAADDRAAGVRLVGYDVGRE